jgi:hypothetical protein
MASIVMNVMIRITRARLQLPMEVSMKKLASALTILILGTGLLYAHHGWTGYDETKPLNFTGVIKDSGYENPHGFVNLEVNKQIWHVVLAPPLRMESRGLPKEKLKAGTTATVVGYQNNQIKDELRAERITIEGKTTELR